MNVYLDGVGRDVRRGASAAALLSEEQRKAAAAAKLFLADAWGHRLGLEGTLSDGGAYFAVRAEARPPSVNACLEAWGRGGAPAVPAEFAKFLVRRAIAKLRDAGGAASAEATAAFAAATAAREDAAALWEYVAGERTAVRVFAAGAARVRDVAPGLRTAVVATRDVLTFRTGMTTFDYFDGIALAEVGTTNKVALADYERALGGVDAVASCVAGDFATEGFVEAPSPEELARAAAPAKLPFVRVLADVVLFDERRAPTRPVGDVLVWATPPEARPYDFIFAKAPAAARPAAKASLYEEAAAALWRFLTKEP
jgi:hypothetical protein